MDELIERLKKATAPDRELDVAIGFAIGRVRERDGNYLYATGNDSDMVVKPNDYDDHIVAQPLSYYTSSLDAALTLVPQNEEREVAVELEHCESVCYDTSGGVPCAPLVHTRVYRMGFKGNGSHRQVPCLVKNRQAALAISLCIAALKSRKIT